MTRHRQLSDRLKDRKGAVIVAVAFALMMLLAFAALAIDVGYLMVVRNELQNAVDAATLALAAEVFPYVPDPSSADAQAKAQSEKGWAISLNKAANTKLTDCQVPCLGYWNMTGSPAGCQPAGSVTPKVNDAAAVMVTVSKSPGKNGGPVNLFLMPLLGIASQSLTAQAVAVKASPGYVGPGEAFPLAISKAMYDQFWNSSTGQPENKIFHIKSVYEEGDLQPGQWTSFKVNAGDLATMQNLINNKNPDSLAIGDKIWIQPGMPPELYDTSIPTAVVLITVVNDIALQGETPIVAFGAFSITAVVPQGAESYVEGRFSDYIPVLSGGPIGPKYGAYIRPRLVR